MICDVAIGDNDITAGVIYSPTVPVLLPDAAPIGAPQLPIAACADVDDVPAAAAIRSKDVAEGFDRMLHVSAGLVAEEFNESVPAVI